jgi:hypothetical protein
MKPPPYIWLIVVGTTAGQMGPSMWAADAPLHIFLCEETGEDVVHPGHGGAEVTATDGRDAQAGPLYFSAQFGPIDDRLTRSVSGVEAR